MSSFSIIINAGGKSSRMGRDKSFLEIGGKMLIEHILARTAGLGDQIIVTNTPEQYAFLGLPTVPDILPDKGALGGLYTAIHAATRPYALVLACDMPFINRPLLEYMLALTADFEAVVPRIVPIRHEVSDRAEAEPFHAVYSKACLGPIQHALDAGKMRVISFYPDVRLHWLEEAEIKQFDADLLTFKNCNTPEDLEEMRQIWKKLDKDK